MSLLQAISVDFTRVFNFLLDSHVFSSHLTGTVLLLYLIYAKKMCKAFANSIVIHVGEVLFL